MNLLHHTRLFSEGLLQYLGDYCYGVFRRVTLGKMRRPETSHSVVV